VTRFKVEEKSAGSLQSEYVHDPASTDLSTEDYLNEEFDSGWECVAAATTGNGVRFIFKANGQP
jgi:hypothetical protein